MCRISIITALHNKGLYIAETINSVRCQTLAEWEMIVVENGSTDDGPEVVAGLAAQDNRIHLIRGSNKVCGPCAARNLGIELAKGKWLLFLDADDLIEPEHLQDLVKATQSTGADVVAGGWREFIEGTDAASVLRDGPAPGATAATVLESCLAFAPWAVHAALIRYEWLGAAHRWPMELERLPSEDSVFWFRLLHGAKLATVPTHSAVYRKETPGNRDAHRDLTLWVEAILRVIGRNEEFLQNHGLRPTTTQAAHVMRSLEALWVRCRKAGAGSEAATVEREAKRWLKMTDMEPGLLMRRIIGIRGFNALRRGIKKC
jgi:glycosyltransferase involved in cell wall biosynthesis